MTITQLIEALEIARNIHGDTPVAFCIDDEYGSYPVFVSVSGYVYNNGLLSLVSIPDEDKRANPAATKPTR